MSSDVVIQRDGPYLRVIVPGFEPDWDGVWRAIELELEHGVSFAEIIAPSYDDEESLTGVRGLVLRLDERGVGSVVEWEGAVGSLMAAVS